MFLTDTIGIYIRKILVQYKIIKKIKDHELYKKLDMQIKIIIGLIIVTSILFLFSYKIKFLQSAPYLCIIYLLQCILGIVCIKEKKK